MEIVTGIKGRKTITVTEEMTASACGSGLLPVFATPAMVALMEDTAKNSVENYLEAGFGTVGTLVNLKHLAATPLGMEVTCETELIEKDRKRLVYRVKVWDREETVGEGTHERFIINNEKFMKKTSDKLNK